MFGKMQRRVRFLGLLTVIFAAIGFVGVWFFAPSVGGNWWPYIRLFFSLIGAAVVGYTVWGIGIFVIARWFMSDMSEMFENEDANNLLDESDMQKMMEQSNRVRDVDFEEKE